MQIALRRAPLTGWLIKRKRENAPSRLLKSSNRRYFTLDFESQVFYYAHSENDKTVSLPIPFQSIRGVVGTGPAFIEEEESVAQNAVATTSSSSSMLSLGQRRVEQHGFIVRTPGKLLELASECRMEAQQWMDAFREAMAVATQSCCQTTGKTDFNETFYSAEVSTRASTAQTVQTSSSKASFGTLQSPTVTAGTLIAGATTPTKKAMRTSFTQLFRRSSSKRSATTSQNGASSHRSPQIDVFLAQPETAQVEEKPQVEEEDPFMRSLSSFALMGQLQQQNLRSGALASSGDDPTQPFGTATPMLGSTSSSIGDEISVSAKALVSREDKHPDSPQQETAIPPLEKSLEPKSAPCSTHPENDSLSSSKQVVSSDNKLPDSIQQETTTPPLEKSLEPRKALCSTNPENKSLSPAKKEFQVVDSVQTCWDSPRNAGEKYNDKGKGLSISQRLSNMEFSDDEDSSSQQTATESEKAYKSAVENTCQTFVGTVVDEVCDISILPESVTQLKEEVAEGTTKGCIDVPEKHVEGDQNEWC